MKSYKIKYPIYDEKILSDINKQKYIRQKKVIKDEEKNTMIIKLVGIIPNIKKIIGEKGELIKPQTFKKFQHIIIREQRYNAYEIKYIKDAKEKIINIFSEKFVKENIYNSILIFNKKLYKINTFIGTYAKEIENLDEINLIFIELKNITDKSYMFYNCNKLKEFKLFEGKKVDRTESINYSSKLNSSIDSKERIFNESSLKNNKTNNNIISSGKKDIVEVYKSLNCLELNEITQILNQSK